jgi:hypothetical protein
VKDQAGLAVETLRTEIKEYHPALVVVSTYLFGRDEIVVPVFGVERSCIENTKLRCWSRKPTMGEPALLWTHHPQGKSNETISAWLKEAGKLFKIGTTYQESFDHG